MLDANLRFFIDHQETLVESYPDRVLLIKDEEVVGDYDSPLDAYLAGKSRYDLGTFTVQPCHPGPEAYTVRLAPCPLAAAD